MAAELGDQVMITDVAQALIPQLRRYLAFEEYVQSPDIGSAPDPALPRVAVGAA
jgi:hypothetical protein